MGLRAALSGAGEHRHGVGGEGQQGRDSQLGIKKERKGYSIKENFLAFSIVTSV